MTAHWFVLRSKPNQEHTLWERVAASGFDVFYPHIRVNPVNPRSRIYKPYFPSYLFVCLDMDKVGPSTFQWMPHSLGLVCFGGVPASVPESLIHEIRKHLHAVNTGGGETLASLVPGDVVKIQHGPFAGYQAIFDYRLPGEERVRVLLQAINANQIPVELSVGHVLRIGRATGSLTLRDRAEPTPREGYRPIYRSR